MTYKTSTPAYTQRDRKNIDTVRGHFEAIQLESKLTLPRDLGQLLSEDNIKSAVQLVDDLNTDETTRFSLDYNIGIIHSALKRMRIPEKNIVAALGRTRVHYGL